MTKKWIAINLLLLLCVGLLGWQLKVSIESFKKDNDPAKIVPARKKGEPAAGASQLQPPRKYNEAEFSVIPAQNLFTESRKPDDKQDVTVQPEIRVLQSKPVLVGTLVSGAARLAMIIDPSPTAGSSSRTRTMRLGDVYQGFVVSEITDTSMVLESGPSREIIPLSDTSKPAQTGKTVVGLARVVNFGSSQGGAPGAVSAAVTAGAAGRVRSQARRRGLGVAAARTCPWFQTSRRRDAEFPRPLCFSRDNRLRCRERKDFSQINTSMPGGMLLPRLLGGFCLSLDSNNHR